MNEIFHVQIPRGAKSLGTNAIGPILMQSLSAKVENTCSVCSNGRKFLVRIRSTVRRTIKTCIIRGEFIINPYLLIWRDFAL